VGHNADVGALNPTPSTGGRIETHFHVFGSLALLAYYRDWKVLIYGDGGGGGRPRPRRGIFYPQSVFGVLTASPWRWVEHAGWDDFRRRHPGEASAFRGVAELCRSPLRQASLEAARWRLAQAKTQASAPTGRRVLLATNVPRNPDAP